MLLGCLIGSASFFAMVFDILSKTLGAQVAYALSIILLIFTIIAIGGGISVIIGALIVSGDKYRLGKFIIGLGAGLGLIGLIIMLITSILAGTTLAIVIGVINGSYGFFGVLLTILARFKLKKPK